MAPSDRPFIHVNIALALREPVITGAAFTGAISCASDWQRVHGLREQYDAVAVGARTWLLDNPRLNVRPEHLGREPRRQPARVIFAGSHRCDVQPDTRPAFVIGTIRPHAQVHFLRASSRRLAAPLGWLRRCGIQSLLVEGGPTLLYSFFAEGVIDCLTIYVHTDCAEHACLAARSLLAELPATMTARPLGEGILLTNESPRRAHEAIGLRPEPGAAVRPVGGRVCK
jgi:2,5-diamino-6-(ribosylamino)-4(3H)-pyrimidinone 5'-phosphate reductase